MTLKQSFPLKQHTPGIFPFDPQTDLSLKQTKKEKRTPQLFLLVMNPHPVMKRGKNVPPCWNILGTSGSRGPWAPGPRLPPRFVQNHAVFRQHRENPHYEQILGAGPPSGVKTPLDPPDQNPGSALQVGAATLQKYVTTLHKGLHPKCTTKVTAEVHAK